MSGQPPSAAGAPAPRNTSNGAANVGMAMPPQQRPTESQVGTGGVGGQNGNPSPQNLNSILLPRAFNSVSDTVLEIGSMPTTSADAANVTSTPETDERPRKPQRTSQRRIPSARKSSHSPDLVPFTKRPRSIPAPRASVKARRARSTASRAMTTPVQRTLNGSNVGTIHDDSNDSDRAFSRAGANTMPTTIATIHTSRSNEALETSTHDPEATIQFTGQPSNTSGPHDTSAATTFDKDPIPRSPSKNGRAQSILAHRDSTNGGANANAEFAHISNAADSAGFSVARRSRATSLLRALSTASEGDVRALQQTIHSHESAAAQLDVADPTIPSGQPDRGKFPLARLPTKQYLRAISRPSINMFTTLSPARSFGATVMEPSMIVSGPGISRASDEHTCDLARQDRRTAQSTLQSPLQPNSDKGSTQNKQGASESVLVHTHGLPHASPARKQRARQGKAEKPSASPHHSTAGPLQRRASNAGGGKSALDRRAPMPIAIAMARFTGTSSEVDDDGPLTQQVIEYLSKKGYSRTEAMLRMESANQEASGTPARVEESGGAKYARAFALLKRWVEENLDVYKAELRRLLWPTFVYSFLNIVSDYYPKESRQFFTDFKAAFEKEHGDELRALEPISLPEHVLENNIAKIYRGAKYRLTMSTVAFLNLIQFLKSKERDGGSVIIAVIQSHLNIVTIERNADDQHSLARMLGRAREVEDFPGEDEGIPGHNPGSANIDRNAGSTILTRLKLGPLPMENDLMGDVQADLEEEDVRNPPADGKNSLVQEFEQHIKREESEDAPNRQDVPLPPSLARDVAMEVQKVKENRDRFRIDGRTGGVGPAVSVTMFTFHNTFDGVNCLDFSQDNLIVAAGMQESYIRVWSLEGKALPSASQSGATNFQPSSSRRLIGHSGPVYAVSFSPSIAPSNPTAPSTAAKYLLSSSADKSVRLWSLETWTCLVIYKGHDHPVWDVTWGPFGHYFVTGSQDKTARLWSTDQITFLRMFVGHDMDVDTVCFHPNNAYVFTGSSDKMVRMWAITNGYPVRMFTGHAGNVTSLVCSPNGKLLASADDSGTIILWDLGPGRLLKRMRGHGKGGIWSLSWSVESTVLVSGGADGTVRVWDVVGSSDGSGQGKIVGEGGAGNKLDGSGQVQGGAGVVGGGGKKKGKDVVVTPDQISAFPTKKSPVYKVRFTRQNLVVAGGAYLP